MKTPGKITGIIICIVIAMEILAVPKNILKETYFKDKICVEVLYTDGSRDQYYMKLSEYNKYLILRKDLHVEHFFRDKTIPINKVYTVVECYGRYTSKY